MRSLPALVVGWGVLSSALLIQGQTTIPSSQPSQQAPPARRVVIIGAGGPTTERLRLLAIQMQAQCDALSDAQAFNVMICRDGEAPVAASNVGMVGASPAAKRNIRSWLIGIKPQARADLTPALEAALALNPDQIYLLADAPPADWKLALGLLESNFAQDQHRITAIALEGSDAATQEALQKVAAAGHGEFRKARASAPIAPPTASAGNGSPLPPAQAPATPATSQPSGSAAAPSSGPSSADRRTGPTTAPAPTSRAVATTAPFRRKPDHDKKVAQLLDYLEKDYAKKAVAPYWVTRAMGVISLARSPRPSATTRLLEIMEKDKHDIVRLLAWEALIARAESLDAKTFARLCTDTWPMAAKGLYRGEMRVALLRLMTCNPPTDQTRRIWQALFIQCNAWDPQDIPVLDALGDCLRAWRSPALVQGLLNALTELNTGPRAEYVLQRAGCKAPSSRDILGPDVFNPNSLTRRHQATKDLWQNVRSGCESWFSRDRANWKEPARLQGEPWKQLKPHYVAAPYALDWIDPDDKLWYADLELGRADLSQFEAVFVVDATGSMGEVLDWLRRDIAKMASSFQMLCKEPVAIGITFYRDAGDPWIVKHVPLTTRLADLEPDLQKITADGGGDIPENVLAGMQDAMQNNRWSSRKKAGSKVMILIGDAPPHENQIAACVALARRAAEAAMRVHMVKATTEQGKNDLSSFDLIAQAGGGLSIPVEFKRVLPLRFVDNLGKEVPFKPLPRPEVQVVVAPQPPEQMPGDMILVSVLSDTISAQYRDRVEPLARVLLAYTQPPAEPERRMPFPANTPPLPRGTFKPQGK